MTDASLKNTMPDACGRHSMKSITPDGVSGAIFALEGIKNSLVLLNAPLGCRYYHSNTSQFLTMHSEPRTTSGNARADEASLADWFFRQFRVPCTYLDSHDYVYGTADKVRAALEYIKNSVSCDFISVVNSPGASLIGDNLTEICSSIFPGVPTTVIESPGFSADYWDGTDEAILALLRQNERTLFGSREKTERVRPRVNLVGFSIWQRYAEGNRDEIVRLLNLCGIDVGCVLFDGCSLEDIKSIPDADLNVVLWSELGRQSALWMEEELGIPAYICDAPPMGFDATEKLLSDLCGELGMSMDAVVPELERSRALCWFKINGVYSMSGRPNGTVFAVKSIPSEENALSGFLTDYLGMIRDSGNIADTKAEEVFADANTIGELMLRNKEFCGIEIANPTMGYVDVVEKCSIGIRGTLFLVEQVLNGLMTRSV